MASPSSDLAGKQLGEQAAAALLVMGVVAVVLVAMSLGWNARSAQLLRLGTETMVVAPLVGLARVAWSGLRSRDRVGGFALGALLVTILGMILAAG